MTNPFGSGFTNTDFWSNAPKSLPSVGPIKLDTAFGSSKAPSFGGGMDPASILSIGSSLVSGIGGIFGAKSAEDAAIEGMKEKARGDLASNFAGFGLDYLTQRYNTGTGAAANRMNTLKEAADTAAFQAYNPAAQNLRSSDRFGKVQDYAARLSAAMPGYVSPLNLFG